MADRWKVAAPKQWCPQCKAFFDGREQAFKHHLASERHQASLARQRRQKVLDEHTEHLQATLASSQTIVRFLPRKRRDDSLPHENTPEMDAYFRSYYGAPSINPALIPRVESETSSPAKIAPALPPGLGLGGEKERADKPQKDTATGLGVWQVVDQVPQEFRDRESSEDEQELRVRDSLAAQALSHSQEPVSLAFSQEERNASNKHKIILIPELEQVIDKASEKPSVKFEPIQFKKRKTKR